jgi:hypothetical protein
MKKTILIIAAALMTAATVAAQDDKTSSNGLMSAAQIVGEVKTIDDSVSATPAKPVPMWKKKLYYGYNFDIYYHHDSKTDKKENGWSICVQPEIGWRLKERVYIGLRVGGSYQDTYTTYSSLGLDGLTYSETMRVKQGSWDVTPYARYRMKSLFNNKVGIWLEGHLYAGMEFPSVVEAVGVKTDYDGLKHSILYGVQVSPVITYQFNRKSSFQIFFSILSLGYSGTTRCYKTEDRGRYNEYSNDVIIFSGKLKNLLANQFTPGLYGLKFGIQKNF